MALQSPEPDDFMKPIEPPATVGRIVHYRSRTGDYICPAIVVATADTLFQPGVDAGHVPILDDPNHLHLVVFTAGKPGMRREADNLQGQDPEGFARSENVAGCYQEWNVPFDPDGTTPGSWKWPPRV